MRGLRLARPAPRRDSVSLPSGGPSRRRRCRPRPRAPSSRRRAVAIGRRGQPFRPLPIAPVRGRPSRERRRLPRHRAATGRRRRGGRRPRVRRHTVRAEPVARRVGEGRDWQRRWVAQGPPPDGIGDLARRRADRPLTSPGHRQLWQRGTRRCGHRKGGGAPPHGARTDVGRRGGDRSLARARCRDRGVPPTRRRSAGRSVCAPIPRGGRLGCRALLVPRARRRARRSTAAGRSATRSPTPAWRSTT